MASKKKQKIIFFLGTICAICTFNFSLSRSVFATSLKLDLKSAIEMAIKNSDELKMKAHDIQKSEYGLDEASAARYPQMSAEAKWQKNLQLMYATDIEGNKVPKNNPTPMNKPYEASLGVQARQVLYAFDKISEAIELARQKVVLSSAGKVVMKNDTIYNTKMAYFAVLTASHAVEIAKASLDNAKLNKNILDKKFATGRPLKRETIQMAADLASRVPTYQNALSKLELNTNNLKMLLGLDENTELELSSTFKNDFSEETLADMPNTNLKAAAPELKNLGELVQLNEKLAHLKSKSSTPTFAAFGAWNFVGASKYKTIGGADRFQSVSAIGLSLQIPIDIGGSTHAQYEGAIQDYYQSKLQLTLTEKKLNLDLHNAIDEFKGLLVTYKANLEAVRLAQSSLLLTRSMFESGKLSLSDLNFAEQLLTMQKFQQEATLFSINAVFARIEKLTAKDLGSY